MHFITNFLALALASSVSAHSIMYGVSVNGVDQGEGTSKYIRSPPNNSPVKDLRSPDLVCGVNGGTPAPSFVKAAGGDTVTFEWLWMARDDMIIDPSHEGPIITYVAPSTAGNGAGPIWTKIADEGYSNGQWAVDKLRANHGKIDVALPNLVAGKYLLRQEIIALHEADADVAVNPARGAQFYPSCVQLEVTGSGTVVPNQNFDINSLESTDPGLFFNLYTNYNSYKIPGPPVFVPSSSYNPPSSGSPPVSAPAPSAAPSGVPYVPPTTLITSVRPAPTEPSSCSGSGYRKA
jgi:cellulase